VRYIRGIALKYIKSLQAYKVIIYNCTINTDKIFEPLRSECNGLWTISMSWVQRMKWKGRLSLQNGEHEKSGLKVSVHGNIWLQTFFRQRFVNEIYQYYLCERCDYKSCYINIFGWFGLIMEDSNFLHWLSLVDFS
jgi:hypothetical protein